MLVFRRVLSPSLALPVALAVALMVASLAAPSRAAAPVRLVYRAAPGCPSQAQFELAVNERGARFDRAPADLGGAELLVSVRSEAEGYVGTLQLGGVSPAPEARAVHAARCEEALRGLAVITALMLHDAQHAATSGPSEERPSPQPDPSSPPARAASEPATYSHRVLRSVGQFEDEGVGVSAGTLKFESALSYTLSAGVDVGLIPGLVMPRYDFTLSRANVVTVPGGDRYLVGGWLPRVRWTVLGSSSHGSGASAVDLLGLKAAFGGCTSFGYDLDGLVLLMCGELGAGALQIESRDASPGTRAVTRTIGLASAGLELNAQYNLASIFHVDARIGGDMTFPALRADRPDGSELVQGSLWSAHATLGLGVHF